ncbi:hypothetical protein Bbelb_129060 [Branchiostoma belcheri]|nr:hypothetical protein Bbelb_129060 [Branchiostoma belcheri]
MRVPKAAQYNPVYCYGPLLNAVQSTRVFKDPKTFVDMSMKSDPDLMLRERCGTFQECACPSQGVQPVTPRHPPSSVKHSHSSARISWERSTTCEPVARTSGPRGDETVRVAVVLRTRRRAGGLGAVRLAGEVSACTVRHLGGLKTSTKSFTYYFTVLVGKSCKVPFQGHDIGDGEPSFLNGIRDENYRQWAEDLHGLWKKLSKRVSRDVRDYPERHSSMYLPYPFITPGGEHREVQYW